MKSTFAKAGQQSHYGFRPRELTTTLNPGSMTLGFHTRIQMLLALSALLATPGCNRAGIPHRNPVAPAESAARAWIKPPADPGVVDLTIDALHPETTVIPSYDRTSHVRVVLVNINPFRFNYRILAADTAWVEASPAQFFEAILSGSMAGLKGLASQDNPSSNRALFTSFSARGTRPPGCSDADGPLAEAYRDQVIALMRENSQMGSTMSTLETKIHDYQESTAASRAVMARTDVGARDVFAAASLNAARLKPILDTVTDSVYILPARITALGQRSVALYPQVTAALDKHQTCLSFIEYAGLLRNIATDTLILRANLKRLSDWQSKADTSLTFIKRVVEDPRHFHMTRRLEGYRKPVQVVLRAQRKYADEDTTHYANVFERRLNFGGPPRFSIGVGVAWTDLATRQYAARKQFAPPFQGRPADTVFTVIGVKEVSYNRVVPMLTLNTRLLGWDRPDVDGLHATLGATIRKDAGTVDPEFLFGGGASGLDERLMLVAGAYVGRTQRLAQGATLGSRLPAGESVPVESKIAWRPAIMISFKIK